MRYFIDYDENKKAKGFLMVEDLSMTTVGDELIEVTKADFKKYFEESGNKFIDDNEFVPAEKPLTPMEKLEQENKLLKAQTNALATNQEFLENCLIEVGQVIYA